MMKLNEMTHVEALQEVRSLRSEVERLKRGGCRFDCRADRKTDFTAGYRAGLVGKYFDGAWKEYTGVK